MLSQRQIQEDLFYKDVQREVDKWLELKVLDSHEKIEIEPFVSKFRTRFTFNFNYETVHDGKHFEYVKEDAAKCIFGHLYSEIIGKLCRLKSDVRQGLPNQYIDEEIENILNFIYGEASK